MTRVGDEADARTVLAPLDRISRLIEIRILASIVRVVDTMPISNGKHIRTKGGWNDSITEAGIDRERGVQEGTKETVFA